MPPGVRPNTDFALLAKLSGQSNAGLTGTGIAAGWPHDICGFAMYTDFQSCYKPRMTDPQKLEKLRNAVAGEKAERARGHADYQLLLDKMKAYQAGKGPEPTLEEFERWRVEVAREIAERKLQSGFDEL